MVHQQLVLEVLIGHVDAIIKRLSHATAFFKSVFWITFVDLKESFKKIIFFHPKVVIFIL